MPLLITVLNGPSCSQVCAGTWWCPSGGCWHPLLLSGVINNGPDPSLEKEIIVITNGSHYNQGVKDEDFVLHLSHSDDNTKILHKYPEQSLLMDLSMDDDLAKVIFSEFIGVL